MQGDSNLDLLISGVGGQGVQLLSKTLAMGAMAEGRMVMLLAEYGGAMRGGSSMASLIVGEAAHNALPALPQASTAIVLHHKYWEYSRLRPGALVVVDTLVGEPLAGTEGCEVIWIPASDLALEAGNPMAMGLVMAGAYAAITGMAKIDNLVSAMASIIPAYRTQHIVTNERAIRMGAEAGAAARRAAEREVMA